MALISAKTIVTSLSLFHITLGFFFFTNPATVADQTLVYVLGEAMRVPHARGFDAPSPALAFLAAVLGSLGVCDLVTLSLPEEIGLVHYWGTQAPLRVLISMTLAFYAFYFRPAGLSGSSSSSGLRAAGYASPGDGLKNRVFFAFMFIEMVSWFWLWVTLREERDPILRRASRRRSRSRSG